MILALPGILLNNKDLDIQEYNKLNCQTHGNFRHTLSRYTTHLPLFLKKINSRYLLFGSGPVVLTLISLKGLIYSYFQILWLEYLGSISYLWLAFLRRFKYIVKMKSSNKD